MKFYRLNQKKKLLGSTVDQCNQQLHRKLLIKLLTVLLSWANFFTTPHLEVRPPLSTQFSTPKNPTYRWVYTVHCPHAKHSKFFVPISKLANIKPYSFQKYLNNPSPFKRMWPFILAVYIPYHLRILCFKFNWNWCSGSTEELNIVKCTDRRLDSLTMDYRWSEKLAWTLDSGELNITKPPKWFFFFLLNSVSMITILFSDLVYCTIFV